MLNYFQVSILLLLIWGVFYLLLKKKLYSGKGYFVLLLLMCSAGLVLPLERTLDLGFNPSFSAGNIILFALLLMSAFIPWLSFENYIKKVDRFSVNPSSVSNLKFACVVLILLSIYAIVYTLPYAIIAYKMGAADVRMYIKDQSLLPNSIFTTVAVGVGLITPVYILLFYISLITDKLKKYSKFLFVGSLTYLVTSAAFQARDGFVFIPLTYYFLYKVFRGSLSDVARKSLLRRVKIIFPILVVFLMIISIDRFFTDEAENPFESLISGTWGYFYQQPYVFDMNLQHTIFFQGIGHRFELIAKLFGLPIDNGFVPTNKIEWMFGTMYSSFYSATGWSSLIIASCFFAISWLAVLRVQAKSNNHFGELLIFSMYIYFLISGLFYFRFSPISITLVNIALICFSFFLKNYITVEYKNK